MAAKQWASREGRPNAGPQTWSSSMSAAIWNVRISSMGSVLSESEYEIGKVCCTRFGRICRVYCIRM